MRSCAISAFPVRLRRFAPWAGVAFVLSLFLQAAALTLGGARDGDAGFVEICTAAGTERVLLAPPTEDAPPPASENTPHCPLCFMTTDDAPPPAAAFAFPLPELIAARHPRPRADSAPADTPDLRHAPPRAPPFSLV
jgi:hypothetical protein